MENLASKKIHIVGGGTIEPIREHLALAARAYGSTARRLGELCTEYMPDMDTEVHLTKMADPASDIETSDDLCQLAEAIITDENTAMIFWSPAVTDFRGQVGEIESGLHATRLSSAEPVSINATPNRKIIQMFRQEGVNGQPPRRDILAVGFKTTTDASLNQQFQAGLRLLHQNSLSLVLANDTGTRRNIIITPEEIIHTDTTDRETALRGLVRIAGQRSQALNDYECDLVM